MSNPKLTGQSSHHRLLVHPASPHSPNYFGAELTRSRGSSLQWLPLIALPLVVMTVIFSSLASAQEDATGVLAWQSLFITGMYAPLIALFSSLPERRETTTRGGGTLWRRLDAHRENAARFGVVMLSIAAFHLLNFAGSWAAIAAQGREHHQLLLIAGLYSFFCSIGIAGLACACARALGFAATLVAAVLWQILSVLPGTVEGNSWWACPPAWPQRLLLRSLRIHQNAVPLEPGDPLLNNSVLSAVLLCGVLAICGCCAAIVIPRPRIPLLPLLFRRRSKPQTAITANAASTASGWQPSPHLRAHSRSTLLRTIVGINRAAFGPGLVACLVLSTAMLVFLTVVYPHDYVEGFFAFALLPLGAGLLPVIVWPLLSAAWPLVFIESPFGPRAFLVWMLGIVAAVCAVSSVAIFLAGAKASTVVVAFLLACGVGYVVASVSLAVTIRFGIVPAIALTIVGTILSLTLGGDILAQTPLWLVALPAWPLLATSPARLATAALLTLLLGSSLSWCNHKLLTTQALRHR